MSKLINQIKYRMLRKMLNDICFRTDCMKCRFRSTNGCIDSNCDVIVKGILLMARTAWKV